MCFEDRNTTSRGRSAEPDTLCRTAGAAGAGAAGGSEPCGSIAWLTCPPGPSCRPCAGPARPRSGSPSPCTARAVGWRAAPRRSEEHTSELQSRLHLVCRLLLEKKKKQQAQATSTATPRTQPPIALQHLQSPT